MSLAVVTCSGESVSPQQSMNFVCSIPRPFARSFIIFTKVPSSPPINSAIATDASLPEAMTMHLIRVSTVWISPSSRNTWDPPIDFAWALVTTSSVRRIFPDCRASKIRISVMIFVTLAGFLGSSAFFSQITVPVDASMRIADGAVISGPVYGVSSGCICCISMI